MLLFLLLLLPPEPFSPSIRAPVPAGQNQSVQGRPFNASDIMIGPFLKLSTNVPLNSCASTSVQYTHIIPTGKGTYRVPHSRIYMDDKQCGPLNESATEDQLWLDSHMLLIPIDYLANDMIALEHGVFAARVKLTTNRPFAMAFYDFSEKERKLNRELSNTWIGFEQYEDRVCGNNSTGTRTLEQNALIFFGKNEHIRVNLTALAPRLTRGELLLQRYHPYHLTFVQSVEGGPEHLCPQIFIDRYAQDERKKINKCFPADAVVHTTRGERRMEDVRVGDRVWDGREFSPIVMMTHRQKGWFDMIKVSMGNITITASEGHYVHSNKGMITMQQVRVGDWLHTTTGDQIVTSTSQTLSRGLYNPQTQTGWLIVNTVLITCYTTAIPPPTAHALLTPIRLLFLPFQATTH